MSNQRPYVTDVETTVKGPRRHVALGKRVLVVGKTAAGKSAIGQSLQLIHSKQADGIDGRDDVAGARLSRIAGPGLALSVEAQFSDGETSAYNMSADGGRGVLSPEHSLLDIEMSLPAKLVRKTLQSGDKAAREQFLKWAASSVTEAELLALVPGDLHDTFSRAMRVNQKDNRIDTLIAVSAWAGKQKRNASSEAKGAQAVLDGLEAPAMPVSDEQLDNLRSDVNVIRDLIAKSEKTTEAAGAYTKLRTGLASVETLSAELADAERALRVATATLEAREQATATKNAERSADRDRHLAIIEIIECTEGDTCPLCLRDDAMLGDAHETHTDALSLMPGPEPADDAVSRAMRAGVRAAESNVASVRSRLSVATSDVTYASRRLGELGYDPMDEAPDAADAVDMSADLERAEKRLESAVSAKATWDQIEAARVRVRTMKKEAERLKDLESVCHDVVAALLRKHVGGFVQKVSSNLPVEWSFSLTLVNEKGKDVFEWEVDKGDGKPHTSLSGSEFETVVMAIAEAAMQSLTYSGPALIQPADKGWSPESLAKVTEALANTSCQVLIESTVGPAYEVDGWTYIYLDDSATTLAPVPTAVTPDAVLTADGEDALASDDETQEVSNPVPQMYRAYLGSLGWTPAEIDVMTEAAAKDIMRSGKRGGQ